MFIGKLNKKMSGFQIIDETRSHMTERVSELIKVILAC